MISVLVNVALLAGLCLCSTILEPQSSEGKLDSPYIKGINDKNKQLLSFVTLDILFFIVLINTLKGPSLFEVNGIVILSDPIQGCSDFKNSEQVKGKIVLIKD